jgi:sugar lactone lactonase YvrE
LVADRSGYLYGAGGKGVVVFAPGCTDVVNVIRPCAYSVAPLAFDQSGNLYAGNVGDDSVCVYAPTQRPGHMKFVRKISQGINAPDGLAIGPSGELFVANYGTSSVSVFAAGGSKPMRQITNGIDSPAALAVDSKGRLYVINKPYSPPSAAAWLSVYAPQGSQPVRKIAGSNIYPTAVALDASDNLYVANATGSGGSVAVYTPGGAKLVRTIRKGVYNPMALLIGSP